MFCHCKSQSNFPTTFQSDYLACDKSRSRVINMRKPSSLKKRLFPLERIPHFRDGFPPLISKNLSDSSWPEKGQKCGLPGSNYSHIIFIYLFSHIFLRNMVSALCSSKIWSHKHRSHRFGIRGLFNILASLNWLTLTVLFKGPQDRRRGTFPEYLRSSQMGPSFLLPYNAKEDTGYSQSDSGQK